MIDGSLIFDAKELFKIHVHVQLCYQRYCKMQNKPEIYFVSIRFMFFYLCSWYVCVCSWLICENGVKI